MICDCWLITGIPEQEHPSLRHFVRKDECNKENSTLLCGSKHKRNDGTERSCIYWDFRNGYDIVICYLCELAARTTPVEEIC